MSSDFDEYQEFASTTDIVVGPKRSRIDHLQYLALGLTGEAGEVADKTKKIVRDQHGDISSNNELDIVAEVGDLLWYASRIADILGFDLSTVAQANIQKLRSRQARGVLGGSGDNR